MKKRSLLSRMFFQDPEKWQSVAPAHKRSPETLEDITRSEQNRLISKQWAKFIITIKGVQTEREITNFPVKLGRNVSDGIKLNDAKVGRHHATIDFCDNELRVKDEFSRNGIVVGGEKIVPGDAAPLKAGAVLKIGHSEIIVVDYSGLADTTADNMELIGDEDEMAASGMACVQCGFVSDEGDMFCGRCGAILPIPKAKLESEAIHEPKAEVSPVSQPEPTEEPEVDSETEQKPEPEPEPKQEQESESGAKSGQKTELKPAPFIIPPKPVQAPTVAAFCNQCGWKNVGQANFCGSCGNRLA